MAAIGRQQSANNCPQVVDGRLYQHPSAPCKSDGIEEQGDEKKKLLSIDGSSGFLPWWQSMCKMPQTPAETMQRPVRLRQSESANLALNQ